MDLVFTEDQRRIREEATRLFAEKSPSERVRQTVEAGGGFDAALWKTVSGELGWCAMAVPEEYGGIGLGLTELAILMEAAGQRLTAVPLWSTACAAAPLVLSVASERARAAILSRIAVGEIAASVAWGRPGSTDPLATTDVRAATVAGGYVLDGRVAQVIDAEAADLLLVPARLDDHLALFALERGAGYEVHLLKTLDGTRQVGELAFRSLHLPAEARIDSGDLAPDATADAVATANLGLAAEQAGAARGVMDLTLAYISERVQFGRTIASFQAIKHRCARLEVDLAEVRALVYGAAANFGAADPGERTLEASGARALASDLLFRAAEEAIQLHGGVGFTWEYDPHLYLKRAQASTSLFGPPDGHLERIAAMLLGNGVAP